MGKFWLQMIFLFHFGADFCNLQTCFYKDFGVTGPVCLDSARSWSRATYVMGPGGIWMGWMLWIRFFSTFQIFILPRFQSLMMKLWFFEKAFTHFSMVFLGVNQSLYAPWSGHLASASLPDRTSDKALKALKDSRWARNSYTNGPVNG